MTFTPFNEEKPPQSDPKTHAGGEHPGETNFSSKAKIPKSNPLGTPKNSVFKRMSALARFRHSPLYQKIKNKLRHQDTNYNASDETFTPANLQEDRAEAIVDFIQSGGKLENLFRFANGHKMIVENEEDFADSVIAILIDAGFDENLVEVEVKGNKILVYIDERIGEKHKDVRNILAEIADVDLIAMPDDNPEYGTFIFRVIAHDDAIATAQSRVPELAKKQESKCDGDLRPPRKNHNSIGPQPDTRNKKGQRVMHDRSKAEVFTPHEEDSKEALHHRKEKLNLKWLKTRDHDTSREYHKVDRQLHMQLDKEEASLQEDDYPINSHVWVVYEGVPQQGTVTDITDFGGEWERYWVRFDDNSYADFGRRQVHASRKEAVKEYNRYRSKDQKIEARVVPLSQIFEQLGSNPKPRTGDIIIDKTTRTHFEVKRILTNDRVEVQATDGTAGSPRPETRFVGKPSVRRLSEIERGLTSGTMSRIGTRSKTGQNLVVESFTEALHTCPNCVVGLVEDKDSFVCPDGCGFVAEFADQT